MPKAYHFATGRLREKLRPTDLSLIRPRCLSWVKNVLAAPGYRGTDILLSARLIRFVPRPEVIIRSHRLCQCAKQ
jgi:hypothetical protein